MANNRIYLTHKPTGKQVCIGKRMGNGWYVPPCYSEENTRLDESNLVSALNKFFEDVELDDFMTMDEMVLEFEHDPERVRSE